MQNIFIAYYNLLKTNKKHRRRFICVLVILSVFVALSVGWNLKITGITMTSDVNCGIEEHVHSAECYETNEAGEPALDENGDLIIICGKTEHTHSVACYSDIEEDVETEADWEKTLPKVNSENCKENLIQIALSQLEYTESTLNYTLAQDGVTKNGYTRYGEWYGNPYADWSSMFCSFCLHYAGYDKEEFPYSAGAYAWSVELTELEIYKEKTAYTPEPGDIVLFCDTLDGRATRSAIISAVDGDRITFVQGDSNHKVEQLNCFISDTAVIGFAVVPNKTCELPETTLPETTSPPVVEIPIPVPSFPHHIPSVSTVPADSIDLENSITGLELFVDGVSIPVNNETSVNVLSECTLKFQFSIGNAVKTGNYYRYAYQIPANVMSKIKIAAVTNHPFYGTIVNAQGEDTTVLMGHYDVTTAGLITYTFDDTFASSYTNINIDDFQLGFEWEDDTGTNPISLDFNSDYGYIINIIRDSNLLVSKYITRDSTNKRLGHCDVAIECFGDSVSVSLRDVISGEYSYTNINDVAMSTPVLEFHEGDTVRMRIMNSDGTYKTFTGRNDLDPNDATSILYTITAADVAANELASLPTVDLIEGETMHVTYDIHVTDDASYFADAFADTAVGTNTAYATIDGVDDENPASSTFSYAGSNSHLISKEATMAADNQSISWTIDINKSPTYSMNGLTVYDYLGQYLTYDTTQPLIMRTYAPNGTLLSTENLNFADYINQSGNSWSYTVNDTGVHSYKFTYSTTINNNYNGMQTLQNGTNGRFLDVWFIQPNGNLPGATFAHAGRHDYEYTKDVINPELNDQFIDWTVTFTVNSGSVSALYHMVVDFLPTYYDEQNVQHVLQLVTKANGTPVDLTNNNIYQASTVFDINVYELDNGILNYDAQGNITNTQLIIPGFNDGVTPMMLGAEDSTNTIGNKTKGFRITKTGFKPAIPQTNATLEAAGYNLPGGFGDYANGYTVVIKYRTTSDIDIAPEGASLRNNAKFYFGDVSNRTNVEAFATAVLPIEEEQVAVTVDKIATPSANTDDTIHYEVKINDGMFSDIPDDTMTWVDTYDEAMEPTGYLYMYFGANYKSSFLSTDKVATRVTIGSPIVTGTLKRPAIRFSGFVETSPGSGIFRYQFVRQTHCGTDPASPRENVTVTITLNKNDHTITYHFDKLPTDQATCNQQQWKIDYDMVIAGDAVNAYGTLSIDNLFQMFGDDLNDDLGFASTVTSLTRKQVSKGCVESNNEFNYSVKISYNDIISEMTNLTITDTMNQYLDLIFSSVTLSYEYADGTTTPVQDIGSVATKNYSSGSGVLTILLDAGDDDMTFADATEPDELKYIVLNYSCMIVGAMIGDEVEISNTVNVEGLLYGSDTHSEIITVPYVNAVGSGTALLFDILKVDGNIDIGETQIVLEGAEFELYDITDVTNPVLITTRTTDNNGMCSFVSADIVTEGNGMSLNTLVPYMLVESEAPAGYVRDIEGVRFFIYSNSDLSSGELVLTSAQQELLANCTPYYISSEVPINFNFVNLQTSYFNINKTDSVSGNTIDYGAAVFTLYSDIDCTTVVETATTESGVAVFTRLAAGTYYVKETSAPPGYNLHQGVYTVEISYPDVSGIVTIDITGTDVNGVAVNSTINSGGTIAFPNRSGVVLPATGGSGTFIFYLSGVFLIACSSVIFVILFIKRRKACPETGIN